MKKILSILALLLLTSEVAFAAPAFDAAATGTTTGVDTISFPLTVANVANRALYVCTVRNVPATSISGVTYATQAATSLDNITNASAQKAELFRRIAPATGANDVEATFSDSSSSFWFGAMSFNGVNQSTPNDAITKAGDAGAVQSSSISPVSAVDDLVADCFGIEADKTIAYGSQTERFNFSPNFANGSTKAGSASSTSMVRTWDDTFQNYTHMGFSINPAPAGGVSRRSITIIQ